MNASGAEAAADVKDVQSPETYVGYDRAENFASPGGAVPRRAPCLCAPDAAAQRMGAGRRLDGGRRTRVLNDKDGAIVYRFHARDLHLVLGPATTVSRCGSA